MSLYLRFEGRYLLHSPLLENKRYLGRTRTVDAVATGVGSCFDTLNRSREVTKYSLFWDVLHIHMKLYLPGPFTGVF